MREDWFILAGESEVGPPESSLHLRNLLEAEDGGENFRKRSLTQRVKDRVKRKFTRGKSKSKKQSSKQLEHDGEELAEDDQIAGPAT